MEVVVDCDKGVLLTGNSVPMLAKSISEKFGVPLGNAKVGRFHDGEVCVAIDKDLPLRNRPVFIIQSTYPPAEHLMELWLLADAARRAKAREIIWVCPYFGYGRQDKNGGHEPISAAVVMQNTVNSGIKEIIAIDLHSGQLQGFQPIPIGNLWGRKLIVRAILDHLGLPHTDCDLSQLAFCSPDAGSFGVASYYAGQFGSYLIPALKHRTEPNEIAALILVAGDKAFDRIAIPLDDMADTLKTMVTASAGLKEKGAKKVIAGVTHADFSLEAIKLIEDSECVDLLFVTDTIPLKRDSEKIKVISVANELVNAMNIVINGGIVSKLAHQFEN